MGGFVLNRSMTVRTLDTGQVITYSAVISACEKHGRWQEALLVLIEMGRLGRESSNAFRAFCHFRSGPTGRQQLEGNDVTYNACISACQKGFQWRVALQQLDPNMTKVNMVCPQACTHCWRRLLSNFDVLDLQRDVPWLL